MPRFNHLAAWLQWQEQLHPQAIELKLERVAAVYQALQLPTPACVVTVAGTNGKGSCVALLASCLRAAAYTIGVYTSPHLLHYNERIQIDGQAASDAQIMQAFAAVDTARGELSLTYFEFGTLAALWLFAQQRLDVVILEVGLGGRLDATNIVDADIAVLSSVGLDHQAWLGNDRESIAYEKAGIFRQDRPAVCIDRQPPQRVLAHAAALATPLYCLGRDFDLAFDPDGIGDEAWHWQYQDIHYQGLPKPNIPGAVQYDNAAGILMVLTLLKDRLPLAQAAIAEGLRHAYLPGRYQHIQTEPDVWLDVGHNPQAMQQLAINLAASGRRYAVVLSVMQDKDIAVIAKILAPYVCHWYLAAADVERALPAAELQAAIEASTGLPADSFTCFTGVSAAFSAAIDDIQQNKRSSGQGKATEKPVDLADAVLVTGSFYTVTEVLAQHYPDSL